jgi:hypothetical protein
VKPVKSVAKLKNWKLQIGQGLVDLIEDLRQVIFARDGGGKFQNLEVEFTIVRLLLLGTPLSIFR